MSHVSPRPRQRRRQANRERLLEVAADLIAAEGVDALSIKKVADGADYTPGALYRYFPSKDALLAAVVIRVIGELAGAIRDAGPESPLGRVVAQALAYAAFSQRNPHGFALITTMIAEPRILIEDASQVARAITEALLPVGVSLNVCARENVLADGDAQERAVLLWASVQGTTQLAKQARIAPDLLNVGRLTRAMITTLLLGWGASQAACDAAFADALAPEIER
ncbi:MAG: TetR/AcrR family transcriptional regulator [Myxococcota bacterium]